MWYFASHTSAKRGIRCYFFSGCRHANEIVPLTKIHETAEEFAAVEAAWLAKTERLFAEKTGHWTEAQRESWRAFLADKFTPEEPHSPATTIEGDK